MEGENRPAMRCPHYLPSFLLDDVKPDPALGLPLVIPDKRLATELEPKRVDHERELRQDKIPFAQSRTSARKLVARPGAWQRPPLVPSPGRCRRGDICFAGRIPTHRCSGGVGHGRDADGHWR